MSRCDLLFSFFCLCSYPAVVVLTEKLPCSASMGGALSHHPFIEPPSLLLDPTLSTACCSIYLLRCLKLLMQQYSVRSSLWCWSASKPFLLTYLEHAFLFHFYIHCANVTEIGQQIKILAEISKDHILSYKNVPFYT